MRIISEMEYLFRFRFAYKGEKNLRVLYNGNTTKGRELEVKIACRGSNHNC